MIQDKQEGELASGRLGKETKEEKEDELASASRALEKGKTDPTSGSLGKEAEVEEAKEEIRRWRMRKQRRRIS